MTAEPVMTVRIPATFYEDHASRDLPAGVVVRVNRRFAYLRVTAAELAELRSDAAWKARWTGPDYQNNRAVCDSAHRTLCALPERFEADR